MLIHYSPLSPFLLLPPYLWRYTPPSPHPQTKSPGCHPFLISLFNITISPSKTPFIYKLLVHPWDLLFQALLLRSPCNTLKLLFYPISWNFSKSIGFDMWTFSFYPMLLWTLFKPS